MNILVIDAQPLMIEGIMTTLRALDDAVCIQAAHDAHDALETLHKHPASGLVVMDWAAPGMTGPELISQLRRIKPALPIVVLSAEDARHAVLAALDAGARGFISKSSPGQIVLGALKLVLAGGIYIPPQALSSDKTPAPRNGEHPDARAHLGLTTRQTEVLALLLEGKPNKLICRELNVSEGTVKTHVSAILRALKISNRAQVSYAVSRIAEGPSALGPPAFEQQRVSDNGHG